MSLRDAIESGNYQNYFTDESNQKKKKKTLREAIEDGTYQNYFEDTDEPEKIQNDSFFKKSEGNTFETILGTTGDIAINLTKGGFGIGEKIGDLLTYAHAGLEEKIGNQEKADSLRRNAQESTTDFLFGGLEKKVDKNSVIGDRGDAVVEGLGYVAGMTAISLASGGAATALGASASTAGLVATAASTATTFSSAMGGAMSEAYKNGANNDEAFKYGVIGGLAEAGSELLFGGLGKASKAVGLAKSAVPVDDMLAKKVSGVFKSKLAKNLSQYAIKAGAEGTEELVSGFISAIGKKVTYMKEEDFNKIVKNENLLEQFVDGMIISGITQAPGLVKSTTKGRDFLSGYTDNENKVYEKLVNDKVNNELKNSTIEQEYSKRVDEQEKMLARDLTEQEKLQVQKEVEEAFDKNEISVESDIDSKKRKEIEEQVKENLQNGKIDTKQIREILGENTDISKDTLLQNSYIQEQRKSQVYVYEKTESAPKNAVMESAVNANMNNTEISRNLINYVAKISEDTGVSYRFVNNEQLKELGYYKENKIINGVVSKDGVVYLNSQSKEAINYVLGHETTHLLENTKEYTELQDLVLDYAKQTGIYEETMNSIKETYSDILETSEQFTNELTSELTSRLLFTDENFVNQLSVKQPNVFQKIYDYIKHMIKMTTSGSEEAKQLEKIKYNFEKAYRQVNKQTNSNLNDKNNYHVSENLNNNIDNILKNIQERNPVKLRDYTPAILVDNGVKDFPMYENPSHIRKNILTDVEAQKLGLAINSRDHYHGLGKELYIKAIDSLDNPRVIFKNNNNNEYLILTVIKDKNNNNIVVPIEIETSTKVNNIKIDINRVKTVYGYEEKNNIDLNNYIKHNIGENKFTKIYEQKKEKGTGFSTVANSNKSIPSSNKDVNTTTKYSMQESENNSKTETENGNDIMPFEKKELIEFTKKQEEELTYWISQKEKLEKVKETLKYEDLRKFSEHWASEYKNNIDGFIKEYYEELRDRIQKNLQNNEKFIKGAKKLIDIAEKENLIISKSPYGDSYYAHKANEGIDWGTKPEGSYRLSDHWNWGGRRALCYGYQSRFWSSIS